MIRGIQVLGMLVSAYLIIQTVIQYRRGNYTIKKTALWLSLWTTVAILFAVPSTSTFALSILSMENTVLAVLVVGLVVAYAIVYETYQQATRTERKLTELAQNLAIHNYLEKAGGNSDEEDEEQ